MKLKLHSNLLGDLRQKRNLFLVIIGVLLVTNLTQAVHSVFRSDRVVIAPPQVRQEYWVEGNRVSATYLEEMSLFYAFLLLDTSPSNVAFKRDMVLKQTVSHTYGALKRRLIEDETRIKKDNVATSFQANEVKVDPNTMSVELTGDLVRYVGEKRVSQSRDTYRFGLVLQHGQLLIESFELIRSDKDE